MKVYLNLGSNLGNRLGNINKAIAQFYNEESIVKNSLKVSDVIESEPWGFQSDNAFLNVGIAFETIIDNNNDFDNILSLCQRIEKLINGTNDHRNNDGNYIDRILDIDIIAIDECVVNDPPRLILPHPKMHERHFVLEPMCQLNPQWVHPLLGISVEEMKKKLDVN